ncbi:HAD family hydrolase [bacterium]|nr:HAD family hydrolase [bacterium]
MSGENKAVFLDRDGVLIEDVHYLSDLKQVQIFQDIPQNLIRLKTYGFKLIVITNQSGIARGYFPESFVKETHDFLNQALGSVLDAFYYCPHHIEGQKPYDLSCNCRKPKPGLVQQAVLEHHIDVKKSFMVGDKKSDLGLAVNSGLSGILVKTGHGIEEEDSVLSLFPGTPICGSFTEAVELILAR